MRVLRRKRAAADRRRAASDRSLHVADEIYAELAAAAMAARQLPPQDPRLTGRAEPMILNAAYLIEADRVDGLEELVAELEARYESLGAQLELTGPWPPYNFVPDRAART